MCEHVGNARLLWIIPAVLLASWVAVRSLAAQSHVELDDPQPRASTKFADPALAQLISGFASQARRVTSTVHRRQPGRGVLTMGRYLVTGGAGFIGSSLARALRRARRSRADHR